MKQITAKHYKAVEELIDVYNKATEEKIESVWNEHLDTLDDELDINAFGETVMSKLTGFSTRTCILCLTSEVFCKGCIHTKVARIECVSTTAYEKIAEASTPLELTEALKERAEYLRGLLGTVRITGR